MDIVIAQKYKLTKKLGAGAFGDIFQGTSLKSIKQVAVKLEQLSLRAPQLQYEYHIYKHLEDQEGLVPKVELFSQQGDFNVMVMDLLGPNLESLWEFCDHQFSEATVAMIGLQMIEILEHVHSKGFLHRDIKPENIVIGHSSRKENKLYLIDYGLAKRYINPQDGKHISPKLKKCKIGTYTFNSFRATLGYEQSRRDDLESLGYMLAYFLNKGELPWNEFKDNLLYSNEERMIKIAMSKKDTPLTDLYPQINTARYFSSYLEKCRSLQFDEKPNYSLYKSLFKQVIKHAQSEQYYKPEEGAASDQPALDWITKRQELIQLQQQEVEGVISGQIGLKKQQTLRKSKVIEGGVCQFRRSVSIKKLKGIRNTSEAVGKRLSM